MYVSVWDSLLYSPTLNRGWAVNGFTTCFGVLTLTQSAVGGGLNPESNPEHLTRNLSHLRQERLPLSYWFGRLCPRMCVSMCVCLCVWVVQCLFSARNQFDCGWGLLSDVTSTFIILLSDVVCSVFFFDPFCHARTRSIRRFYVAIGHNPFRSGLEGLRATTGCRRRSYS